MKPKYLIILAAFALLVLTVGFLHFGGHQTQAAAQNRAVVVPVEVPDPAEPEDGGLIPVWIIRGVTPTDGYLSCDVVYADGRRETVPLDGWYELDDRYYFLVSLFPETGDWGATVRLYYNRLDRTQAGDGADRVVVLEKVAPQLPADRPLEGFVWRGEELPGCNVWRWEVNL